MWTPVLILHTGMPYGGEVGAEWHHAQLHSRRVVLLARAFLRHNFSNYTVKVPRGYLR